MGNYWRTVYNLWFCRECDTAWASNHEAHEHARLNRTHTVRAIVLKAWKYEIREARQ